MPRFTCCRLPCVLALFTLVTLDGQSAQANFHLWFIKEIYSNQSGSVQFIELFTPTVGQEVLSGKTITSTTKTFTFPSNSSTPTTNHHLLIATSGFGSLAGGATPDFTLPANFFNVAGDTITFAGGVDTNILATVPTDGVNSLNYTSTASGATTTTNTPRNFAGSGGSVNLAPPSGDYNGNHTVDAADFVLWRNTFTQTITAGSGADGSGNGTVDAADYTYWRARFGKAAGSGSNLGSATSAPEPAAFTLLFATACGLALLRRSRL